MSDNSQIESDRQLILDAQSQGKLAKLGVFFKLSGPGWLQSALTLGGGTLGSSLYLGILGGTTLLWLQPFAMVLGVIMMSAISYVALSTGERPFRAINKHINPVLGWSWLAASMLANMVWSLPQYSLCFAVCEQNFFPEFFSRRRHPRAGSRRQRSRQVGRFWRNTGPVHGGDLELRERKCWDQDL